MMKKIICLFFIFTALTAVASPVNAGEQTVFGPSDFKIGVWYVHLSRQTFNLDVPGDGYIEITKNTPDEDINGGVLFFNGRLIPLRQFLIGDDLVFQKDVTLKANNRLTVFLRGTPGASVTIEIKSTTSPVPPPGITFSAQPSSILNGESSTLSWVVTNADMVSIDNDIGSVSPSGSMLVFPQETTTYTITGTGSGGTASASVTITVNNPSLTVSITADPTTISQGGSSTLSWTSLDAETAYIDNNIGQVSVDGSTDVNPDHTTTYTITVTEPTGCASAQVTVMVTGNPAPQPEGTFGEQYDDLVPPDATVEEYDPKRFSVITSLVQDVDGLPVEDIRVNIHEHPEYGTAVTDTAGRFSLPVEGGGTYTIQYQKEGLISAHRKVYVPLNDIAVCETIQMITEDPVSTTLTFDGNPDTVVAHRSTKVSDVFGTRSCTMVFSGDNLAYLVDEEGNDVYGLTTITVRATEFSTDGSMPARLPPNSAYTYCAELTVDGAQRVRFDKPVITWVDNFLGFDVGMIVPVGYYDRDRGVWVPSDNGVVVRLLDTDTDGIVDALDADGDDQPDDLDNDGSFDDEVTGLENSAIYPPGATFWRVAVTHFTPWDCNWPSGPPLDAIPPNPGGKSAADQQKPKPCTDTTPKCSFVEDRSRIFHEDVSIPGTDITLHYSSNRVEGYKTNIDVPVSGDTVPDSLKRIFVKVEIAGRILEQIFDPLPDQRTEFFWDGTDYLGRPVSGPTTAKVSVGFEYELVYMTPAECEQAFAQAGEDITAIRGRREIISWKRDIIKVYPQKAGWGHTFAEGWTLSTQHQLSSVDPSTLIKGDGTIDIAPGNVITTIAGNGTEGHSGDGDPAIDAQLDFPSGITQDAEGNIYIAEYQDYCIRKVDPSGIITTVVKGLQFPGSVVVDAQGNIYIAESYGYRICKVDNYGNVTTVAGNGTNGFSGDGGPATEASISRPLGIALGPAGDIYFADTTNHRIRKVSTGGIITTVAGNGIQGFSGDGGPAVEASLSSPLEVVADTDGNIYIADSHNHSVRKISTNGIITTVAGNGTSGFSGDGGLATDAQLNLPDGMALDAEGNIYICDRLNERIRKVSRDGIITTIAGKGISGSSGDGGLATDAYFSTPAGVALGTDGSTLYICDSENNRIRKIGCRVTPRESVDLEDISFVDSNGRLEHVFSSSWRHTATIDLDTGVPLYEFEYDNDNNLIFITDQFDNSISIQRDGMGVPTGIISPDGIVTNLAVDANNHLTRITYPNGSHYDFEYTSDGLMTAKIEPEGNRFEHQFDSFGRMTNATDEQGGQWNYTRNTYENGDILTEILTGEGNVTTYLDHTYTTGLYTSTITSPSGAETLFSQTADGLIVNKSLPCGMELEFKYDVDSEYQFKYVKEMRETTPSSLEKITLKNKTYSDTDSDYVPDLITETVALNGKDTAFENDVLQAQKTMTSPEGRTVTTLYNPNTLLTESVSVSGLLDISYGYDTRGRLISISTGSRQSTFFYNTQGFLETVTDSENHTTTYTYDAVGRVTGVNRPDNTSLGLLYDENGNMTVLTNPSSIDHVFGYNAVNLSSSYQTPLSGSYGYVYDKDRRLIRKILPSGDAIVWDYTNPGDPNDKSRLWQIQTPEGNIDFDYLCGTKVGSITNGANTITYGYDGTLVTSETLTGTLAEFLNYSYNNDFNVTGFTYAGDSVDFYYDNDGLLTGAGNFSIARNIQNGLPEAVTDGTMNLDRIFNGYGEVEEQDFDVNGQALSTWTLTRDNNGRITHKTETVGGLSSTYDYGYDEMGRLISVIKDGTLVEEYGYDSIPYGTCTYQMNALRGITDRTLQYDDEDKLLTVGGTTYQYDPDGFLTTKTSGSDITTYDYSTRGELLSVSLPDGTSITYVHGPLGRRIAKKVNGAVKEKYLWQGMTRLLAVHDGSDNLLQRFEYADGRMPVAMTQGSTTYYLTYDQVGSLRLVADISGNVVKRIDYDSFGNILSDSNPTFAMPFGFAGGLYDPDTGLVRFGYRDYDPDTGRWTAKDPILFVGGDTDLYGYCLYDPVNFIDSNGQFINLGAAGIGAAIGAGVGAATALFKGESVIQGALTGAVVGSLAGLSFGTSLIVNSLIGASIGAVTDIATQHYSKPCGEIDSTSVFISAFAGAIGGGTGTAMIKGGTSVAESALFSGALSGGSSMAMHASANH